MKKIILFCTIFLFLYQVPLTFADLQSTTYDLKGYSFGSGGTTGNTSTTYSLFGISGQTDQGSLTSTTYQLGAGLTYIIQAYTPPVPTLATPGVNYDRILLTINIGNNPSDSTFAVQESTTSNFSSNVNYVKSDGTLGPTLASTDWRTYTSWGGASGTFVTGLIGNTTYYFRATAQQGSYTQTPYGSAANITTNIATLSFTLDSNIINFSNLNSGNSYTDNTKTTTLTTTTNAYNGYTVYGQETQALTTPDGNTITDYASPNSAPTTWGGTGFGYNTNNTTLVGGTANRFSGNKYAGFGTTVPGYPVASDVGPVTSSEISAEQFIITYRVTGNNTTPAGTYQNTILYTIVPSW
jgi:hypothetical protein